MSFVSLISFIKIFSKLKRFSNYKFWTRFMYKILLQKKLWSYVKESWMKSSIIKLNWKLKNDLNHVEKIWKRQEQRFDWMKNVINIYKRIFSMCNENIRQKIDNKNTNRVWRVSILWKYLKIRYISFNWAFKWIIIIKLQQLRYNECKSIHKWKKYRLSYLHRNERFQTHRQKNNHSDHVEQFKIIIFSTHDDDKRKCSNKSNFIKSERIY